MDREGTIRFSIIVPVYNVQNYLAACVGSVAGQPGPGDWECILVDDGSTDLCPSMCDKLAAEIPGVTVIHQANGGLAAARNTGIRAARGEWLLFLDSDDRMAPDLLPRLRAELDAQPGVNWFVGRYLEYFEADGTTREPKGLTFRPGLFQSEDYRARVERLYSAGHWSVWKYCLRRRFLLDTGLLFWPKVRWGEDWPFDLMLLERCDTLCFLDTVFTIYRVDRSGSLLTDPRNLPLRLESTYQAILAIALACCPHDVTVEMLEWAGNVFWSLARSAAVKDKEVRRACRAPIENCRAIYDYGREVETRRDWRLFRWMVRWLGARFALWAAAQLKKHGE